jgi:hypothetical protein
MMPPKRNRRFDTFYQAHHSEKEIQSGTHEAMKLQDLGNFWLLGFKI